MTSSDILETIQVHIHSNRIIQLSHLLALKPNESELTVLTDCDNSQIIHKSAEFVQAL